MLVYVLQNVESTAYVVATLAIYHENTHTHTLVNCMYFPSSPVTSSFAVFLTCCSLLWASRTCISVCTRGSEWEAQYKQISVKILDRQGSGIHFSSGMVPTLLPDVVLKFKNVCIVLFSIHETGYVRNINWV